MLADNQIQSKTFFPFPDKVVHMIISRSHCVVMTEQEKCGKHFLSSFLFQVNCIIYCEILL